MSPPSAVDLYLAIREGVVCIFLIGIVLAFNGFAYVGTVHFFRSSVGTGSKASKLRATFFFILCTQLLALAQLGSIGIWAIVLFFLELAPDWISAVRMSASSYTTLGDFPGGATNGWHLMPAFIAFSGLFSFSWAATSTITMVNSLNHFIDTNKSPVNHSPNSSTLPE